MKEQENLNLEQVQQATEGTLNGFAVEEVLDLIEDKLSLMSASQIRRLMFELEVLAYNLEQQ